MEKKGSSYKRPSGGKNMANMRGKKRIVVDKVSVPKGKGEEIKIHRKGSGGREKRIGEFLGVLILIKKK